MKKHTRTRLILGDAFCTRMNLLKAILKKVTPRRDLKRIADGILEESPKSSSDLFLKNSHSNIRKKNLLVSQFNSWKIFCMRKTFTKSDIVRETIRILGGAA